MCVKKVLSIGRSISVLSKLYFVVHFLISFFAYHGDLKSSFVKTMLLFDA